MAEPTPLESVLSRAAAFARAGCGSSLGARRSLGMVTAPIGVAEAWIWAVILSGYPPLFLVFALSQRNHRRRIGPD